MNETALTKHEAANAPTEFRRSTDAAHLCREIVLATAVEIQKRKYVRVEGWQAIALAHGCVASARDVKRIDSGVSAIGEVRRMTDGVVLATAEGFVGDDETGTWGRRPEYAKRAMAQTRAISRACRSAFAHVVVMMNAGLETTPAEEVPSDGFEPQSKPPVAMPTARPAAQKPAAPPAQTARPAPAAKAEPVYAQLVVTMIAEKLQEKPTKDKKSVYWELRTIINGKRERLATKNPHHRDAMESLAGQQVEIVYVEKKVGDRTYLNIVSVEPVIIRDTGATTQPEKEDDLPF